MIISWFCCYLVWLSCSSIVSPQGTYSWRPAWVDRFYLAGKAWLDVHWVYRQELDAMSSFWDFSKQLDISCVYKLTNLLYGSIDSLRSLTL